MSTGKKESKQQNFLKNCILPAKLSSEPHSHIYLYSIYNYVIKLSYGFIFSVNQKASGNEKRFWIEGKWILAAQIMQITKLTSYPMLPLSFETNHKKC